MLPPPHDFFPSPTYPHPQHPIPSFFSALGCLSVPLPHPHHCFPTLHFLHVCLLFFLPCSSLSGTNYLTRAHPNNKKEGQQDTDSWRAAHSPWIPPSLGNFQPQSPRSHPCTEETAPEAASRRPPGGDPASTPFSCQPGSPGVDSGPGIPEEGSFRPSSRRKQGFLTRRPSHARCRRKTPTLGPRARAAEAFPTTFVTSLGATWWTSWSLQQVSERGTGS